ncbi:MAG: hypothetical protein NWE83_07335 [Candidatus Bathyarchaeota archaeon]|nr:hypothetical protein [Candidatus Bathyarchaeota archaeon]
MVYMHIILFVICLNFGMGIAHIPGTPLSITDAYNSNNMSCFNDFAANGMLTYHNSTQGVVNGVAPMSGTSGNFDGYWTPTANHQNILDLGTNVNATGYNPITEAIESSYQAGETVKDFVLGGYITNILDHVSLNCDFDPNSPTYGQAIDTAVWQYFKTGINVIFGLLIGLAVLYLITGRSFGL